MMLRGLLHRAPKTDSGVSPPTLMQVIHLLFCCRSQLRQPVECLFPGQGISQAQQAIQGCPHNLFAAKWIGLHWAFP